MYRLVILTLFFLAYNVLSAKPPKEKLNTQINSDSQITGISSPINDACLLNINAANYLFTTSAKGIYLNGLSTKQLEKGNFGAICAIQQKSSDSIFMAIAGKKYNTIEIYQFNPKDTSLQLISASEIPSGVDEIIQMRISQDLKLYILGKRGGFEIMEIFRLSWGELDAKIIYSTYLPEKPKDFTTDQNCIWGTYEKGGFWKIDVTKNKGSIDVSYPQKLQLKKIKTPFNAIESFNYKGQQFLILNDYIHSTFIIYNVVTKQFSKSFNIALSAENDIVNGGNILLSDSDSIYILDEQTLNVSGSNFKIVNIHQLSSILEPLLP